MAPSRPPPKTRAKSITPPEKSLEKVAEGRVTKSGLKTLPQSRFPTAPSGNVNEATSGPVLKLRPPMPPLSGSPSPLKSTFTTPTRGSPEKVADGRVTKSGSESPSKLKHTTPTKKSADKPTKRNPPLLDIKSPEKSEISPTLDSQLAKRNGKRVAKPEQAIPPDVLEGPMRHFPSCIGKNKRASHGFFNSGNDCYRNATLQALIHVPVFYRYMGKMHKDCKLVASDCVVCALQALVTIYWTDNVEAIRAALAELHVACGRNPPTDYTFDELRAEMKEGRQGEAMEFLQYLMVEIYNKALPSDDTQFSNVFDVALHELWMCGACHYLRSKPLSRAESNSNGPGGGIDVHIQEPAMSLTLIEYLQHEYVNHEIQLHCNSDACRAAFNDYTKEEKANFSGPVQLRSKVFVKTPEVLIIRLMRFDYDRQSRNTVKITYPVPFQEYLNLREFAVPKDDIMYRLDAVVAHKGASNRAGHYITVARRSSGTHFCILDDDKEVGISRLGRGTFTEMQWPLDGDFNPYILFYSKM